MPRRFRRPRLPATPSAAAVLYEEGVVPAPVVVAAGEGLLAQEIVSVAHAYGVPVVEDPWLAAALSQVRPGTFVPAQMYQVIAELLAFLYTLDAEGGKGESSEHTSRDGRP